MNDYSFGSGWASGGGFSADYGLSPYSSSYSNQGFQVPSFNNSNNGYSSSGTNYSLGSSYGGSSSGFSTPNYSGGNVGTSISPYPEAYRNIGFSVLNPTDQEALIGQAANQQRFGITPGKGYLDRMREALMAEEASDKASEKASRQALYSLNDRGFNSFGLDASGRNFNPNTGLNYKTGGFNYDSGLTPFEGSSSLSTAASATGDSPSEFSPNSMVKDDLDKRLQRGAGDPKVSPALDGIVKGLNSLFSSKNAGNTVSTVAGLFQGGRNGQLQGQAQQQNAQQMAFAQQQAQSLASMFGQDSSYAQALRKQLDRKDAAGGRRSQYGTREVELQAKLAQMAASTAPAMAQLNAQAGGMNTGGLAMGQAGLATDGQQLKRVIDLANGAGAFNGLGDMFRGIGNSASKSNREYDSYDLQGSNNLTGGGNFWDTWFK